ncbi:MAG: hypothetical protein WC389_14230 [Lutibacter sp.]|jgi:hypothetical protein
MTQKEENILKDAVEKADLFGLTQEIMLCIVREIEDGQSVTQACRVALEEWDIN